jgi:hypothetical protein
MDAGSSNEIAHEVMKHWADVHNDIRILVLQDGKGLEAEHDASSRLGAMSFLMAFADLRQIGLLVFTNFTHLNAPCVNLRAFWVSYRE